ncbi:metallophosphoesterase [Candidatus Sumerlaeota bacterium]|nr:metallophosphoesterase [Candidatus Sumerlaeota bacterium]
MKIFIGDLHLGCGDERDDFLYLGKDADEAELQKKSFRRRAFTRMHQLFEKFIEYILRMAEEKDNSQPPELVLLGDIFDLLQVEPVEEEFRKPARLQRIYDAHKPFFSALNHFAENGGRITFVIGNHDHELVDKKMFKLLREFLPSLNKNYGSKPLFAYVDEEWGIYAEHGNQLDPVNRFNDFKNPEELPVGSIIVIKLVNPFEPSCPLFDNIQGTYETLWYAASRLPELVAPELLKQSREYQKMNLGLTATLINHLLYILVSKKVLHIKPEYLPLIGEAVIAAEALIRKFSGKKKRPPRYLNHLRILSEATQSSILSQAERILAYPERAHLLSRVPKKLNVLLFGHTHQPLTLRTESGVYANCGCWRPRAIALYRKVFRLRQTLNFVVVSKTRTGKVRVRLLDFLKTLEREASPENT